MLGLGINSNYGALLLDTNAVQPRISYHTEILVTPREFVAELSTRDLSIIERQCLFRDETPEYMHMFKNYSQVSCM